LERDWFAGISGKEVIKKILYRCLGGASKHQIRDRVGFDGADLEEIIKYLTAGGCLRETECACGHCISYATTPVAGKMMLAELMLFRCGRDS